MPTKYLSKIVKNGATLVLKDTEVRSRVDTTEYDIAMLQAAYQALQAQTVPVIGALPASGQDNVIYRVPGVASYSEYMWDGTQFVLMATFANAIDNTPTDNSENLVTSGGVKEALDGCLKVITQSQFNDIFE